MTYEEEQVTVAVEELKKLAGKTMNQGALAALDIIIEGFEDMRPYVRVGLRVSPSDEALEAINLLHSDGILTLEQRNTMMITLRLPRERTNSETLEQPLAKPFRGHVSSAGQPCRRNAVRLLRPPASRFRRK